MDRSAEEAQTKEMDIRSLSSSHRHSQSERYIHKVGVPPKQNLFKEFRETLKETFFADDPLRPFKDQSRSQKFILGIQTIFPIFEWGRKYNLKKLRGDLIAGLTIASLCIPQASLPHTWHRWISTFSHWNNSYSITLLDKQDIGYAKLANLDPQYGLCKLLHHLSKFVTWKSLFFCPSFYLMIRCLILFFTFADSSFVPPLIYAFMGSSRDIAIGPVAVVSLLLGTMLQNELDPINEKDQYQRLAFTATFFAGITQVTLGFLRYSGTYFSSFQKKLN